MSGVGGFVAGLLGLTLLDAALASKTATGNASNLISLPEKYLSRWLDITEPLIPQLSGGTSSGSAGSSGSSSSGGTEANAFNGTATAVPANYTSGGNATMSA